MVRVITYVKENNLLQDVAFIKGNDFQLPSVSVALFGKEMTKDEFMHELSSKGLGIFIDTTYPESEAKSKDDYIGGNTYELNITPFEVLGVNKVTCMQFLTPEFDEEEVNNLLNLDPVRRIYDTDADFRKIIDQITAIGGDWKIILNYLTREYGFKFTVINYIINEEEG